MGLLNLISIYHGCSSNAPSLNLTTANHVFLMEPQWNPMLEEQALDVRFRPLRNVLQY